MVFYCSFFTSTVLTASLRWGRRANLLSGSSHSVRDPDPHLAMMAATSQESREDSSQSCSQPQHTPVHTRTRSPSQPQRTLVHTWTRSPSQPQHTGVHTRTRSLGATQGHIGGSAGQAPSGGPQGDAGLWAPGGGARLCPGPTAPSVSPMHLGLF